MAQAALDLNPFDSEAVDDLVARALADIEAAADLRALRTVKSALLSDQAPSVPVSRKIGQLASADRGTAGRNLGGARARLPQALTERGQILEAEHEARALVEESVDVTAFGARSVTGAHHPIGALTEEVEDFFTSMGWEIAEGPEIKHEWFNFDSLNFDIDHPVRQIQDTLYIDGTTIGGKIPEDGCLVTRTCTPSVQLRSLLARGVSLYVARPGKIFRSDAPDATHTPILHQVEGLAADKGLTMAHLKGVPDHFAEAVLGPDVKVRLRPSFFLFTEPSAELDMRSPQKKGGAGWIEVGGYDTVNPNVLRANGIGPDEYTDFVFDMGIECTLMFRHDVADMYDIIEGDVRSSQQLDLHGKDH